MIGFFAQARAARSRGLLLLLFLALILVVMNVSQWFVLRRVANAVEEEIGRRLIAVAEAGITAVTANLLLEPSVGDDDFVTRELSKLARRHDLADVFLLDPDGIMLFDLDGGPVGDRNPFLEMDFVAFSRATGGASAHSDFVPVDGQLLKAAYVPVRDDNAVDSPVEAVLGVSAGGTFHASLPALRRRLWGISIGSAAVIALLGGVFFRMQHRLSHTEVALARSETLSAMGMMAAGVAHEVRNPLAIISGTAERLKRKYGSGATSDQELFDFIPEEVERLNGILEGYLRFARDEPLAFAECSLGPLVHRCAQMVRDDFGARGVELKAGTEENALVVAADPQRLQQVLLNLLLNAAQAMPEGGSIDLELTAVPPSAARITVRDRGSGFDAKALRGAFQPFFTTKEQGSGLGLAMARRIVEGHGGSITLANHPDGGALVTVELPVDGGANRPEE